MSEITWRDFAACLGKPVDWWFPHSDTGGPGAPVLEESRAALATCAVCPVLLECRAWGIAHELHGIWGGTSARERARIRREQSITVTDPGIDMDRVEQVNRAVHLFKQGWRAAEIAGELGTTVRTVHRMLTDGGVDAYPPPMAEQHDGGMKTARGA